MKQKSKTLGELYGVKGRRKKINTTKIFLLGIISGLFLAIIVIGIYSFLFM